MAETIRAQKILEEEAKLKTQEVRIIAERAEYDDIEKTGKGHAIGIQLVKKRPEGESTFELGIVAVATDTTLNVLESKIAAIDLDDNDLIICPLHPKFAEELKKAFRKSTPETLPFTDEEAQSLYYHYSRGVAARSLLQSERGPSYSHSSPKLPKISRYDSNGLLPQLY